MRPPLQPALPWAHICTVWTATIQRLLLLSLSHPNCKRIHVINKPNCLPCQRMASNGSKEFAYKERSQEGYSTKTWSSSSLTVTVNCLASSGFAAAMVAEEVSNPGKHCSCWTLQLTHYCAVACCSDSPKHAHSLYCCLYNLEMAATQKNCASATTPAPHTTAQVYMHIRHIHITSIVLLYTYIIKGSLEV